LRLEFSIGIESKMIRGKHKSGLFIFGGFGEKGGFKNIEG
jgi:hypothetical protein